ncbi:MAG: PspC domain-containing protein [Chloroflexi bacterium]|nr:PspC domain-containing protein [Chloroflexota bacterium]
MTATTRPRLYRSRTDRTIFGVCGGLGDYFGVDPAFLRLGFVILLLSSGIGIVPYLAATLIIPEEPPAPPETESIPTETAPSVDASSDTPAACTAPRAA